MGKGQRQRRVRPRQRGLRDDGPDVTSWGPKRHPSDSLRHAFHLRCLQVEREILARIAYEKQFNEYSFDSGWAVEDVLRAALKELLPRRYSIYAGSVSDSKGFSAGDCDVVIFNDEWFPVVKAGPSLTSRRLYLPIEGVYAVLEVKQSLSRRALENAMEKLVSCHRLFRPDSPYDRTVENDPSPGCDHFISNPLYSAIVATDLSPGFDLDSAVTHFVRINQLLPRVDVIRSLCILGRGTIIWAYDKTGVGDTSKPEGLSPATFKAEDRYAELVPVFCSRKPNDSPFFELVQNMMGSLFLSVLAPENLATHYGYSSKAQTPSSPGATLLPDPTLLARLDEVCTHGHSPEEQYHMKKIEELAEMPRLASS